MPVLVTGIHVFFAAEPHVDPRDKPGGTTMGRVRVAEDSPALW